MYVILLNRRLNVSKTLYHDSQSPLLKITGRESTTWYSGLTLSLCLGDRRIDVCEPHLENIVSRPPSPLSLHRPTSSLRCSTVTRIVLNHLKELTYKEVTV